jgi:hypothetical protein
MSNQSTKNNHYWLNGLEMYFERYNPDVTEIFHDIKELLLRGDIYKIRNALYREIQRGETEDSYEFLNTILNQHLPHNESVTVRRAIKYLAHSIDDEYLRRISVTVLAFSEHLNLNDHFSRGQMMSKFWMIDELKEIADSFENLAHYGGWYGTIYQLLNREFDIKKYRNFELDKLAAGIADRFNYKEVSESWRFKSVVQDVNDLYWRPCGDGIYYKILARDNKFVDEIMQPDLIINTSCEHMDETWFHNIPDGKLICLQTNDYFSNEQHINCVENEDVAEKKYPMSELLFKGTLNTPVYNRFMLIGRK